VENSEIFSVSFQTSVLQDSTFLQLHMAKRNLFPKFGTCAQLVVFKCFGKKYSQGI